MRDKKVRAWDKVTETYLYSDKFPSMWQFYKELENRGIRHFETEEYTGLKDKNGVEIYEFDILSYKSYRKPTRGEVRWGLDGWWIWNLDYQLWETSSRLRLYDTIKAVCEVIGNIYENPELLEK